MEEVIDVIRFGIGVAERDRELERYFIQTRTFKRILAGRYDLILGTKGSGKSAISKVLGSGKLRAPELENVDCIIALPTQMTILFSNLPLDVDEFKLRRLWTAFFVTVAFGHVRDVYPGNYDGVIDLFKQSGINPRVDQGRDELLATLIGSLAASAGNDSSGSVSSDRASAWHDRDFSFESLVTRLDEIYSKLDKECWILLDRLDEAFPHSIEERALRGLLEAHRDIDASTERLRVKVFLRSDIYSRVTESSGFRNLDHLEEIRLTWHRENLIPLVAERIRATASDALGLQPADSHLAVIGRLLPKSIQYDVGGRTITKDTIDWCIDLTESRQGEPSPRNVLRLLHEAQQLAIDRFESDPDASGSPNDSNQPLIRSSELLDAFYRLSQIRRIDALNAEYHYLKPFLQSFQREPSPRISVASMERKFRSVDRTCSPSRIIADLERAGFLHQHSANLYDFAPLYRPAFDIGIGATPRSDDQTPLFETHRVGGMGQVREVAKELASQGQFDGAVRALLNSELTRENAVLAANIAVQARNPSLIRDIEDVLDQRSRDHELTGRRIAVKFALGNAPAAVSLARGVGDGDELSQTVNRMIGTLSFDSNLEGEVWRELLSADSGGSLWDTWAKLLAASRLLSVSRGMRARSYDDSVQEWFSRWHPPSTRPDPAPGITYLQDVAADYTAAMPELRPYQVLSVHKYLSLCGWSDPALEHRVVRAVAHRVQSSAREHRKSFREWASLEPLARTYMEYVEGTHGG